MNSFVYDIPVKVYFGENQLSHLGEELSRYGKEWQIAGMFERDNSTVADVI